MTMQAILSVIGVSVALLINIIALVKMFARIGGIYASMTSDLRDLRGDYEEHIKANINAFNNLDRKIQKVTDRQFDDKGAIQWVSHQDCRERRIEVKQYSSDVVVRTITQLLDNYHKKGIEERNEIKIELRRLSESIAVMESRVKI